MAEKKEKTVINLDEMNEANENKSEFWHNILAAGIGYALGKKTNTVIRGNQEKVDAFIKAMKKFKNIANPKNK